MPLEGSATAEALQMPFLSINLPPCVQNGECHNGASCDDADNDGATSRTRHSHMKPAAQQIFCALTQSAETRRICKFKEHSIRI
jgi:hypothetical protein